MNKDNKQRSKIWAGNSTKKWEISKIAIENVPSSIREYTHQVSLTCLPKSELNKDSITGHTKMDREKHLRPQPYTRNCTQQRKDQSGRGVFPRGEHTNWLSSAIWGLYAAAVATFPSELQRQYSGNMPTRSVPSDMLA